MKFLFLLFYVECCFLSCSSQPKANLDIEELIQISALSDFSRFKRLVYALEYIVWDSSRLNDGNLFYMAKEPIFKGRSLACSVDQSNKLSILTYATYSGEESDRIKTDIVKLGFVSSGVSESFDDFYDPEDFEKGDLIISYATRKKEGKLVYYEFTFLKL